MSLDVQALPEEVHTFLGPIHQLEFPPQGDTSTVAVVNASHGTCVIKRSQGYGTADLSAAEYEYFVDLYDFF